MCAFCCKIHWKWASTQENRCIYLPMLPMFHWQASAIIEHGSSLFKGRLKHISDCSWIPHVLYTLSNAVWSQNMAISQKEIISWSLAILKNSGLHPLYSGHDTSFCSLTETMQDSLVHCSSGHPAKREVGLCIQTELWFSHLYPFIGLT